MSSWPHFHELSIVLKLADASTLTPALSQRERGARRSPPETGEAEPPVSVADGRRRGQGLGNEFLLRAFPLFLRVLRVSARHYINVGHPARFWREEIGSRSRGERGGEKPRTTRKRVDGVPPRRR